MNLGKGYVLGILLMVFLAAEMITATVKIEGRWSTWSKWTKCTVPCGTGISKRDRVCEHPYRRTVVSLMSRVDNSLVCFGPKQEIVVCNTQNCPTPKKSFREEQCSEYNHKIFSGKNYVWKSFINPIAPCELTCRPEGQSFYARLSERVPDGTECGLKKLAVCIRGKCLEVACDGTVGNNVSLDKCGVCNGDNSTCRTISGLYTQNAIPVGYNHIINIPKGTTNVNITETKATTNYLVLKYIDGSYILNGNYKITSSGDYSAAGTIIQYSKRTKRCRGECIYVKGPTNIDMELQVLSYHKNPGILYSFDVPANITDPYYKQIIGKDDRSTKAADVNIIQGRTPLPSVTASTENVSVNKDFSLSNKRKQNAVEHDSDSEEYDTVELDANYKNSIMDTRETSSEDDPYLIESETSKEVASEMVKPTRIKTSPIRVYDRSSLRMYHNNRPQHDSAHAPFRAPISHRRRPIFSQSFTFRDRFKPHRRIHPQTNYNPHVQRTNIHRRYNPHSVRLVSGTSSDRKAYHRRRQLISQRYNTAAKLSVAPSSTIYEHTRKNIDNVVRRPEMSALPHINHVYSSLQPTRKLPTSTPKVPLSSPNEDFVTSETLEELVQNAPQTHDKTSNYRPNVSHIYNNQAKNYLITTPYSKTNLPFRSKSRSAQTRADSKKETTTQYVKASQKHIPVRYRTLGTTTSAAFLVDLPKREHSDKTVVTLGANSKYKTMIDLLNKHPNVTGMRDTSTIKSTIAVEPPTDVNGTVSNVEPHKEYISSEEINLDKNKIDFTVQGSGENKNNENDGTYADNKEEDEYSEDRDTSVNYEQYDSHYDSDEGIDLNINEFKEHSNYDLTPDQHYLHTDTSTNPNGRRPIIQSPPPRYRAVIPRYTGYNPGSNAALTGGQSISRSILQSRIDSSNVASPVVPINRENDDIVTNIYVWKISGISECTTSCGGGLQQTVVVCLDTRTQAVVTNENCAQFERPDNKAVTCNSRPCPARWVLGKWGPCSKTCGTGSQSRTVICKTRVSPTLNITLPEERCSDVVKPNTTQECQVAACYTWTTGNWSKCSNNCGEGTRRRDVHCTNYNRHIVADIKCTLSKPVTEETCGSGSCGKGWFYTEWPEECPASCGEATLKRKIHCADDESKALPEKSCDIHKKPRQYKACQVGTPCAGQWFTGNWGKCNATCGPATRNRNILCIKSLPGGIMAVVGEDNCQHTEKPEVEEFCELTSCRSEWFMTDWSECSVSCNGGVKTRQVKCLDEDQQPRTDCKKSSKPRTRDSCNTYKCSVDSIILPSKQETSDSCKDTYSHCTLVTKARLCRYSYYKKVCCLSCQSQT